MGIKDIDAYIQGGLAYEKGTPQEMNPYKMGRPSWESWDKGWRDAVPVPGYPPLDGKEHKDKPSNPRRGEGRWEDG